MPSPLTPPPTTAPMPLLALEGITKRYPSVVANDAVSLRVMPGEIHAVLGENGAGKSTLMKVIYGATQPDAGRMLFQGQEVRIANPQVARQLGIAMVFQHFSLFDSLSVAQNVWLGLDAQWTLPQVRARIVEKAAQYGLDIEPERPVHTLSVGEMQRVEIIRALLTEPRLLILDEPTSVLIPQAVDKLFVVLRQLVAEGCGILYISHKLHEIRALCTRCTVLRAGRVTGECDPRLESNASLSQRMIGAEPPTLQRQRQKPGAVVMQVVDLALLAYRAMGSASCWPLCRARTAAPQPKPWCLTGKPLATGRQRRGALWVCTLCPMNDWDAVRCRAWTWRTTCCSPDKRRWGAGAGFICALCAPKRKR
jgi:ABC-type uncharacterized transport system ATPase subunit